MQGHRFRLIRPAEIEKAFGPKVDLILRIQAADAAAQVRKRNNR
jgi:hypothetical protein